MDKYTRSKKKTGLINVDPNLGYTEMSNSITGSTQNLTSVSVKIFSEMQVAVNLTVYLMSCNTVNNSVFCQQIGQEIELLTTKVFIITKNNPIIAPGLGILSLGTAFAGMTLITKKRKKKLNSNE